MLLSNIYVKMFHVIFIVSFFVAMVIACFFNVFIKFAIDLSATAVFDILNPVTIRWNVRA